MVQVIQYFLKILEWDNNFKYFPEKLKLPIEIIILDNFILISRFNKNLECSFQRILFKNHL